VSGGREACERCLRRAWLVGSLSGHIEKAMSDVPGKRARELLALPDAELAEAMARSGADAVLSEAQSRRPRELRASITAAEVWAICRHQDGYPPALHEGREAPAVLFGRGDRSLLAELGSSPAVTVVGSRRPSGYGTEMATMLGHEAAAAGLAVVSGMALGIDSCAHRGALEAGGPTVAVLGGGADVPYPARMRKLHGEIAERGLVLSELPPGTRPRKWTFPARNRIMAALGTMTVVVEARERSGSLITADMASDLGREVGAVPGRVGNSSADGTNSLLREGAHVIRSGQDVLDSLLGAGVIDRRRAAAPKHGPALEEGLAAVLEAVERGASSLDAVALESNLAGGKLAAALTRLELLGYLGCDSAGRYRRTALAPPEGTAAP
jgi:DNA processing protein